MSLYILLLFCVFGKLSHAQLTGVTASSHIPSRGNVGSFAVLPENCSRIFNEGSTSPYNSTSIAAVFQSFCSIRQRMSQCIADNQQQMLLGNNPLQWSTALLFNKRVFDEDSASLCTSLPSVADDLKCLATVTHAETINCSSILLQSVPPIFQRFRTGTITKDLARKTICRISNTSTTCWLGSASNCSKNAIQFSRNYYNLFFGTCASDSILETLPETVRNSIFVTCFIDSFSDIIEDVLRDTRPVLQEIVPYIDRIMQYVCRRIAELSQCFAQRARNTTNPIDIVVLQFVNVSNIGRALGLFCQSGQDFQTATDCLIDVPIQGEICGKIFYAHLFKPGRFDPTRITTTTSAPSVDELLRRFCPPFRQAVDCTYLPLSRCSRNLTNKMNTIVNMLMTDRCRAYGDFTGLQPWNLDVMAASFIQCGRVVVTQIGKATVGIGGNATIGNELAMIKQAMAIGCRDGSWFLTCVDDRIMTSRNVYDRTLREILDFSSGVDSHRILRDVCQNITEIQSGIQCILDRGKSSSTSIYGCLRNHTGLRILSNATELSKLNGNMMRARFCKPIESLLTCAKDSFGSCSTSLDSIMDNIPRAILRTDCGGIRITKNIDVKTSASTQLNQDVIGFATLMTLLMVGIVKILVQG